MPIVTPKKYPPNRLLSGLSIVVSPILELPSALPIALNTSRDPPPKAKTVTAANDSSS